MTRTEKVAQYIEWAADHFKAGRTDDARDCIRAAKRILDGCVIVPREAINFIKGAGPDHEGFWFGDGAMPGKGNFRWRARFDAMIAASEEGE